MRLLITSLDGPSIISSHRTSSLWFRMGFVGQALAGVKIGTGHSEVSHQQWGWDKSLQAESFPE